MSLSEFLVWLTGAGSIVAVSFLAERWPWFQTLAAEQKKMFMFGACIVLSLGAFAVRTFVPPEILAQLAPWFGVISSVFAAVFLSETFHAVDKKTPTDPVK
jgi:hypothetical protein